jgi:anti-sigma factor NepR-like protein
MFLAAKCPPQPVATAFPSADAEIRDFVAGKNDGENLLRRLYDHVLDEPIPDRLLAVLKG